MTTKAQLEARNAELVRIADLLNKQNEELLAALKEAATEMNRVGALHAELHGTKTGPSAFGAAFLRARQAIAHAEGKV